MHRFPSYLLDGYSQFMSGKYADERQRYHDLANVGQTPESMIIACCDSRAAPETIFGAGPGELFVVRNVANLVPPFAPDDEGQHGTSAALEFGVTQLGIKNIVVMGHGRCGGINAMLHPQDEPLAPGDFIGKWLSMLHPVAKEAHADADLTDEKRQTLAERLSIRNSILNLRTFPYIGELEAQNKIALHGAWFDIKTGELWILDEKTDTFFQPELTAAS